MKFKLYPISDSWSDVTKLTYLKLNRQSLFTMKTRNKDDLPLVAQIQSQIDEINSQIDDIESTNLQSDKASNIKRK